MASRGLDPQQLKASLFAALTAEQSYAQFPLKQAEAAHRLIETRHGRGKIVLTME
ncbi:zinc-binding dehydrogenase [Paenibacillus chitinolyticus]|uniref:zinc-binding dehydrogenase n=1 Tax=Paenibacillus chitinolyticus TaxID=79263 RepID=UPI00386BE1FD